MGGGGVSTTPKRKEIRIEPPSPEPQQESQKPFGNQIITEDEAVEMGRK